MIVVAGPSYPVLALWIGLAATDGLDGWLARRMGTTRSGAFLDPLADKALVLGAMWAVVAIDGFWWLPVALITGRELAISGFRSYWGRRGLAVPATFWAKVKTVVQAVAVGLAAAAAGGPGRAVAGRDGAVAGGGPHRRQRRPVRVGRQPGDRVRRGAGLSRPAGSG